MDRHWTYARAWLSGYVIDPDSLRADVRPPSGPGQLVHMKKEKRDCVAR